MEETDQNKLFVGGISWETTEDVMNEHFKKYGVVLGTAIAKDRVSGKPRGFAFVTFSESSAVDRALQDSHQILGRAVEVKRAIPRSEQQSWGLGRSFSGANNSSTDEFRTRKIFVGGLAANLTEEEFRSYFVKFGRITDVVVMHDNMTHRPRGFGFITFDSEDSVEEVMQKNFHELAGKLVEVKRAVPKDWSNSSGSNMNSHHPRVDMPYIPRFGYIPTSYGAGMFGGVYPSGGYGGIIYGFSPVGPESLWAPAMVGVSGGFSPYPSPTPFFPAYSSGGLGMMSLTANGYGGFLGNGFLGKSELNPMAGGDSQHALQTTSSQNGVNNASNNHFSSGGSSRQGKVDKARPYQASTNSR